MKRILFFSIFISYFFSSYCQEIKIYGNVKNAITSEGISKAIVNIFNTNNSRLLASDTTRLTNVREEKDGNILIYTDKWSGGNFSLYITNLPKNVQTLLLRIQAKSFEPFEKKIDLKKSLNKRKITIGTINLFPTIKEQQLDEVTITATKIKMFYKGDTIVYNANALNITQSESLRNLVERLPNAKLENGKIIINGKAVNNLLLSGKDFFNGNIQAALDNLPAYIVDKLKVYNKSGEMSELTGKDMHDEMYVLDVHLKRQYIGIWMAKLGADTGTENLWGTQGFLMRMDERQMFMMNTDANNFNQKRRILDIASTSDFMPSGRYKSQFARAEYYIEPNNHWRLNSYANLEKEVHDLNTWTNTETFLSPYNQMTRSETISKNKKFNLNALAKIRYRKPLEYQHELSYEFNFDNNKQYQDLMKAANFKMPETEDIVNTPLDSLLNNKQKDLLYTLFETQKCITKDIKHKLNWYSAFTIGGELLNIKADWLTHYNKQDIFNNYNLSYIQTQTANRQRRLYDNYDYATAVNTVAEYTIKYCETSKHDGGLTPYINFSHDYGTASHPLYRLDLLNHGALIKDWSHQESGELFNTDLRSLIIDIENTYYSKLIGNKAEAGLNLFHKIVLNGGGSLSFKAKVPLSYTKRKLNYERANFPYFVSRRALFFAPEASAKWSSGNKTENNYMNDASITYQLRPNLPALTLLLPIRNAEDPLNIFLGNSHLKSTYLHSLTAYYTLQNKKSKHTVSLRLNYERTHNDISTKATYDATHGGNTYQPVNTNRTHNAKNTLEYSLPIDSKKHFFITAAFETNYFQTKILSSINTETLANDLLKSLTYKPYIRISGTISNNFQAWLYGETRFQKVKQPNFSQKYRESLIRGYFSWILPLNIELSSEFTLRKQSGFSDPILNRTLTFWNARLSRLFLHEKLRVYISANDILADASTLSTSITPLSRIETYTDVMPRYVMIGAIYSFDWTGKKK